VEKECLIEGPKKWLTHKNACETPQTRSVLDLKTAKRSLKDVFT